LRAKEDRNNYDFFFTISMMSKYKEKEREMNESMVTSYFFFSLEKENNNKKKKDYCTVIFNSIFCVHV
jgi:hypothetical protein